MAGQFQGPEGGRGHTRPGHGAWGHPCGQHNVRGSDAGRKPGPAKGGLRMRLPGDIRQEAQAHPQESGDSGGGGPGGQGAGDGGEEIGTASIYFSLEMFFEIDKG